MRLLLIQEIVSQSDSLQVAAQPETLSWLGILIKGGWVMIPIALLSVLTIYLFFERLFTLWKAKSDPLAFTDRVKTYVQDGDIRGAIAFCTAQDTPISHILKRGLERLGRPIIDIQEAVQAAGKYEAFDLEKRIDWLASIAGIAPMLGFLGTVGGMIDAFQRIQALQGNVNPSVLAEGIWEALVTTAFGLAVGIMAYFAYNFLLGRIKRRVNDLERSAHDFIDLLQEPVPAAASQY